MARRLAYKTTHPRCLNGASAVLHFTALTGMSFIDSGVLQVLWRQKEQFSDGVGYGWIDGLKDYANSVITDQMLKTAVHRYGARPFPFPFPAVRRGKDLKPCMPSTSGVIGDASVLIQPALSAGPSASCPCIA
jgi:hypothetical protein